MKSLAILAFCAIGLSVFVSSQESKSESDKWKNEPPVIIKKDRHLDESKKDAFESVVEVTSTVYLSCLEEEVKKDTEFMAYCPHSSLFINFTCKELGNVMHCINGWCNQTEFFRSDTAVYAYSYCKDSWDDIFLEQDAGRVIHGAAMMVLVSTVLGFLLTRVDMENI
ncbi:hypothetical protein RRG08_033079 [Elysia crispata]|uniref:Uncharacterized protein n=1 Tax=Elysia crispata TaxID=231223 RepID=A0AAE1A6X0_9GAST|nr:hypothetical protein RRG08_033079 [Elysia crispata]